jgi:peptide/nickel transport system substrate-binding protein
LLNVQRGAHQIAIDVSADQATSLAGKPGLDVSHQPSPWVFYVFTNDDPRISMVTSNPLFQRAVREALDYQGLRALGAPGAVVAPGLIPSMIPGALPAKDARKRELTKARADLAASGVGNQRVLLQYSSDLTISGVSLAVMAQRVQADLAAAGFDVTLVGSPTTTFQPAFRSGKLAFGVWLYAFDYPDPVDYLVFTPGQLIALHAGWAAGSDPSVEKLATRASAATAPAERRSRYQQLQRALNARSPFIPLIQPGEVLVSTTDLTGVQYNSDYGVDLTRVASK